MKPAKEDPIRLGGPKPNRRQTLQEYLDHCATLGITEHRLKLYPRPGHNTGFILHPASVAGETLDFVVRGNDLEQLHVQTPQAITKGPEDAHDQR